MYTHAPNTTSSTDLHACNRRHTSRKEQQIPKQEAGERSLCFFLSRGRLQSRLQLADRRTRGLHILQRLPPSHSAPPAPKRGHEQAVWHRGTCTPCGCMHSRDDPCSAHLDLFCLRSSTSSSLSLREQSLSAMARCCFAALQHLCAVLRSCRSAHVGMEVLRNS